MKRQSGKLLALFLALVLVFGGLGEMSLTTLAHAEETEDEADLVAEADPVAEAAADPVEEPEEDPAAEPEADPEPEAEAESEPELRIKLKTERLEDIKVKGEKADYGVEADLVLTLEAEAGYELPASVTVVIAGARYEVAGLTAAEIAELERKGELKDDAIVFNTDASTLAIPAALLTADVELIAAGVALAVEPEQEAEPEPELEPDPEPDPEQGEEPVAVAAETVVIQTQPEPVQADVGETVYLSVTATGAASYQWQYSTNQTTWNNSGLTGNKTNKLTVVVKSGQYAYYWRCLLKDANGAETPTNVVRILKKETFAIQTQPEPVEADVGETDRKSVA